MTQPTHGIIISVLRHANPYFGDCTNNGISHRFHTLTLVGPGIPEIFPVTDERPAVRIEQHVKGCVRIVPADDTRQLMAGGNYAALGDSRLDRHVENLLGHTFYGAVAIHDRYEEPGS